MTESLKKKTDGCYTRMSCCRWFWTAIGEWRVRILEEHGRPTPIPMATYSECLQVTTKNRNPTIKKSEAGWSRSPVQTPRDQAGALFGYSYCSSCGFS